jgi:hypothetical protein
MPRDAERCEGAFQESGRVGEQGAEQSPVGGAVDIELRGSLLDRTVEECRRPIVEGMRYGRARVDPPEAMLQKRKRAKERGERSHGVHGGTDVVGISGQRELGGPRSSADLVAGLEDQDRSAGSSKRDGSREPVWP